MTSDPTATAPTVATLHDEEGDRWTQALRLVEIARECFAAAVVTS